MGLLGLFVNYWSSWDSWSSQDSSLKLCIYPHFGHLISTARTSPFIRSLLHFLQRISLSNSIIDLLSPFTTAHFKKRYVQSQGGARPAIDRTFAATIIHAASELTRKLLRVYATLSKPLYH